MKRTRKYTAALPVARALFDPREIVQKMYDNDLLYEALEAHGYFWDAKSGAWSEMRKSTSVFESDEGRPTGEFRVRLMAHPGEIDRVLEVVSTSLRRSGCAVTEVSGHYPNRRGPGVRVYVTAQISVEPAEEKSDE